MEVALLPSAYVTCQTQEPSSTVRNVQSLRFSAASLFLLICWCPVSLSVEPSGEWRGKFDDVREASRMPAGPGIAVTHVCTSSGAACLLDPPAGAVSSPRALYALGATYRPLLHRGQCPVGAPLTKTSGSFPEAGNEPRLRQTATATSAR